jgi:hypothetical protein
MPTRLVLAAMIAAVPATAFAQGNGPHDNIDALIEQQSKVNKIPASFVHRVVKRESNYNPRAKGGSALGLMQIKHATARGMGYKGDAAGLYDPETNLKYGIAYLATAYRLAKGDLDQAYRYYNRGFYYAAKRLGIDATVAVPDDAPATPSATPVQTASSSNDFSKLFGLSSGQRAVPVQTASADPQGGLAGTTALAYAAAPAGSTLVEVPLPPRRPASLGAESAQGQAPAGAAVQAEAASSSAAQSAPQVAAAASSDLIEVPLPPRRPSATVLMAMARPAAPARKATASAETIEATALPAGQ